MEDDFNNKKKQKMKNTTLILTIIVVVLLVYVVYDLVTGFFDKREQSMRENIFNNIEQGIQNCSFYPIKDGQIALVDAMCVDLYYSQGYYAAIYEMIQVAQDCNPVSLNLDNQSIEVIDVSCLQQETIDFS